MQHKDDFDSPGFKAAVGSIFRALDRRERVPGRGPVWAGAVVMALVVFLLSVLWYSYPREAAQREIMAVPIIRADAGPVKVVPRDPGGMDIPHRDSTIFQTLRAGDDTDSGIRQVENLLDDAEEPLSRDQIFAGLRTELKVEGREVISVRKAEDTVTVAAASAEGKGKTGQDAGKDKVAPETGETANPAREEAPAGQKIAASSPVPKSKPETDLAEEVSRTEPAAGVETFKTKESGQYFVQLASLRSHEAAQTAWQDLQKSMIFLQPHNHRVKKAELGAKGVFYRVQAGPFAEGRARDICAAVEAQRPGGCLVVRD